MNIRLQWNAAFWDMASLKPGRLTSTAIGNKVAASVETTDGGKWELHGERGE
jgi:hypothetical protein